MRGRPHAILLMLALASVGCGPSAGEALTQATAEMGAGDDHACQTAFRRGLERHPDDPTLLLFAVDFYLREGIAEHYKPRLALHYANRLGRVSDRPEAAAALVRSLRAMGQHDDAEATLQEALTKHPGDPLLQAL